MHLLRSIVILIALLAQAWPVVVVHAEVAVEKCSMSCCAGNDAGCGCLKKTEDSPLSAPANVPPDTWRGWLPQVATVSSLESHLPSAMSCTERCVVKRVLDDRHELRGLPCMTVLHCAFLI